ncbi:MAG: histidine phosphatase family protein [Micavibrio aeruginosavorus]|uniref:Histidine phosphatase family protein n=1 Tax=Micavibrio aeruginosavorus TaxID=349221 RepID=A0A7T5R0E8_9BACT|nr:MAG: histidine phosphatase family protein [Micavibrio aeruginosavorus]
MLPLKPFYLIRHGQSRANERHITAGGLFDSPLTDLGRQQAQRLSPFLKKGMLPPPSRVYHSTMIRARDTADILNQGLALEMVPDFDLREHDMGVWDGLPWAQVLPQLKAGVPPPGGETTETFAHRIRHALKKILITSDVENPPLIVAHGGLFHAIGFLYEYAMSEIQNCHLHYFEPVPDQALFPWHVWQFDVDDHQLVRTPAPFNINLALASE